LKNKATIILAISLLTMIGCQKPQELDSNKGSSDSSKVVLENGKGEKENKNKKPRITKRYLGLIYSCI